MSRRNLIKGGIGVAGVAALAWLRPADRSGARHQYFLRLQGALQTAGIATPTLVIDQTRLNANVDLLMSHLPEGMAYRMVAKSLPSPQLIAHILQRTGSERLMTFNIPMLTALSESHPMLDQLLGKPMPVAAARNYFHNNTITSDAAGKVQWLIDTPIRLAQYSELADALGTNMRINIELDVGLHRGGFTPNAALNEALRHIHDHPRLSFAGFMGYEPHISSIPTTLGWQNRALKQAWEIYGQALAAARGLYGDDAVLASTRNAAGSPTYRLYKDTKIANEISAGSCLVKPSHFDTPLLSEHQPASFIAAPVLKTAARTRTPGLEFTDSIRNLWDPNYSKSVFTYGGKWLAKPVDPPGLRYNPLFGRSSNQELMNAGAALNITPDEFVFLRPHQSEAVFLQFGDISVYDSEAGSIIDQWPVFPASA